MEFSGWSGPVDDNPVSQDLGGTLHGQFCKPPVLVEISRKEISTSPSLTTWKSTRGCPSYVTSKCDGVTQYIQRRMVLVAELPSWANTKIFSGLSEPFTHFRVTMVVISPVPNPLVSTVSAAASQRPSGDRASPDQIVSEPLQPVANAQTPMNMSEIALQQRRLPNIPRFYRPSRVSVRIKV